MSSQPAVEPSPRGMVRRDKCMNDSGDFQDEESDYNGKLFCVPSQPAVVPSSRGMLRHHKRLPLDTWNASGFQENVFESPLAPIDSSFTLYRGMLHSWNHHATDGDPVRRSMGGTCGRKR